MKEFSLNSKVWVYQSNRKLNIDEVEKMSFLCSNFIQDWVAHGSSLKSSFKFIDSYFLVLAVDEDITSASGCSIDSSVKFIKELGLKFKIDFFNRMNLVVKSPKETKLIAFSDLTDYKEWNVYNPLVNSIHKLNTNFLLPVEESEFYKMLSK